MYPVLNSRKEVIMKKTLKRTLTPLLLLVLVFGTMPAVAFAQDSRKKEPTLSDYQAILDACNAEFGTDAAFTTPEQRRDLGEPPFDIRELGTLEEFEAEVRAGIEMVSRRSAEAEQSAAAVDASRSDVIVLESRMTHVRDSNGRILQTVFEPIDIDEPDDPQTRATKSWYDWQNYGGSGGIR